MIRFLKVTFNSAVAEAQPLSEVPLGASALIRRVGCARATARRLMEMGLLPGTRVEVRRVAPLGDPIELRLRGYALCIRRAEAADIEVEQVTLPEVRAALEESRA